MILAEILCLLGQSPEFRHGNGGSCHKGSRSGRQRLRTLTGHALLQERARKDTRVESELLREFADGLRTQWPGVRLPEVYYDPRTLSSDAATRAAWHAKCLLIDNEVALVTSANFTEWAHRRNVEAGVLVRSAHFTSQLRAQFDGLVHAKAVRRVPGL